MKNLLVVAIFAMMFVPLVGATHTTGCTPTQDEKWIPISALGNTYYVKKLAKDDIRFPFEGPFVYQEANGLPGVQLGGTGLTGGWFPPGCDQIWTLSQFITSQTLPGGTGPCLFDDEDPVNDETCTHGPDTIVF